MPTPQRTTPPIPTNSRRAPVNLSQTSQDAAPDDLGHESMQSNIKRNTTGQGERTDRGD
jgi:hypothetical protein